MADRTCRKCGRSEPDVRVARSNRRCNECTKALQASRRFEVLALEKLCQHKGCQEHAVRVERTGGHYCSCHYYQRRRAEALQRNPPCSYSDCVRPSLVKGVCTQHYNQNRLARKAKQKCTLCGEPLHMRGWCLQHYNSWRRYGDPLRAHKTNKRGEGCITSQGYRILGVEGSQVLEHRLVVERALGRQLREDENIHHINGNRLDNRYPENLEIWVVSQPAGQRVEDKVAYARELIARYPGMIATVTPAFLFEPPTPWREVLERPSHVDRVWRTLSQEKGCGMLVSSIVSEITKTTPTHRTDVNKALRSRTDLFESMPRKRGDPSFAKRWRVRPGATPPKVQVRKGCINSRGYRRYSVNRKEFLEHRLVVEAAIGRKLLPHENVHHKNGDKLDNRYPENLEVWSVSQPKGQRVQDLVNWAREIIDLYGRSNEDPDQEDEGEAA